MKINRAFGLCENKPNKPNFTRLWRAGGLARQSVWRVHQRLNIFSLCGLSVLGGKHLPLCFDVRADGAFGDRFGAGLENGFGNCNIGLVGDFDVGGISFDNRNFIA